MASVREDLSLKKHRHDRNAKLKQLKLIHRRSSISGIKHKIHDSQSFVHRIKLQGITFAQLGDLLSEMHDHLKKRVSSQQEMNLNKVCNITERLITVTTSTSDTDILSEFRSANTLLSVIANKWNDIPHHNSSTTTSISTTRLNKTKHTYEYIKNYATLILNSISDLHKLVACMYAEKRTSGGASSETDSDSEILNKHLPIDSPDCFSTEEEGGNERIQQQQHITTTVHTTNTSPEMLDPTTNVTFDEMKVEIDENLTILAKNCTRKRSTSDVSEVLRDTIDDTDEQETVSVVRNQKKSHKKHRRMKRRTRNRAVEDVIDSYDGESSESISCNNKDTSSILPALTHSKSTSALATLARVKSNPTVPTLERLKSTPVVSYNNDNETEMKKKIKDTNCLGTTSSDDHSLLSPQWTDEGPDSDAMVIFSQEEDDDDESPLLSNKNHHHRKKKSGKRRQRRRKRLTRSISLAQTSYEYMGLDISDNIHPEGEEKRNSSTSPVTHPHPSNHRSQSMIFPSDKISTNKQQLQYEPCRICECLFSPDALVEHSRRCVINFQCANDITYINKKLLLIKDKLDEKIITHYKTKETTILLQCRQVAKDVHTASNSKDVEEGIRELSDLIYNSEHFGIHIITIMRRLLRASRMKRNNLQSISTNEEQDIFVSPNIGKKKRLKSVTSNTTLHNHSFFSPSTDNDNSDITPLSRQQQRQLIKQQTGKISPATLLFPGSRLTPSATTLQSSSSKVKYISKMISGSSSDDNNTSTSPDQSHHEDSPINNTTTTTQQQQQNIITKEISSPVGLGIVVSVPSNNNNDDGNGGDENNQLDSTVIHDSPILLQQQIYHQEQQQQQQLNINNNNKEEEEEEEIYIDSSSSDDHQTEVETVFTTSGGGTYNVHQVHPSTDDFEILKPISRGGFGAVYLARKKKTGDLFALKIVKRVDMLARKNPNRYVKKERDILKKTGKGNPFVVTIFWAFQSKDFFYLVLEFVPGGDLFALLQEVTRLDEKDACNYAADIVLALEYIHGLGVVHRDLKPDNLVVAANGHLKLTDFGLSSLSIRRTQTNFGFASPAVAEKAQAVREERMKNRRKTDPAGVHRFRRNALFMQPSQQTPSGATDKFLRPPMFDSQEGDPVVIVRNKDSSESGSSHDSRYSFVGTPYYIAPEIIRGEAHDAAVDFWSLGVIVYELLTGSVPFVGINPDEVMRNIITKQVSTYRIIEAGASEDAKQLILALLNKDPTERPSIPEIKAHAFFKDIDWENHIHSESVFSPELKDAIDTSYFDSRNVAFNQKYVAPTSWTKYFSQEHQELEPAADENFAFAFQNFAALHELTRKAAIQHTEGNVFYLEESISSDSTDTGSDGEYYDEDEESESITSVSTPSPSPDDSLSYNNDDDVIAFPPLPGTQEATDEMNKEEVIHHRPAPISIPHIGNKSSSRSNLNEGLSSRSSFDSPPFINTIRKRHRSSFLSPGSSSRDKKVTFSPLFPESPVRRHSSLGKKGEYIEKKQQSLEQNISVEETGVGTSVVPITTNFLYSISDIGSSDSLIGEETPPLVLSDSGAKIQHQVIKKKKKKSNKQHMTSTFRKLQISPSPSSNVSSDVTRSLNNPQKKKTPRFRFKHFTKAYGERNFHHDEN